MSTQRYLYFLTPGLFADWPGHTRKHSRLLQGGETATGAENVAAHRLRSRRLPHRTKQTHCSVHSNKVVHFYNAHNTECISHDMVDVANTVHSTRHSTHSKLLVKSNHSTIAKACILLGISCSRTVHCAADHPLTCSNIASGAH